MIAIGSGLLINGNRPQMNADDLGREGDAICSATAPCHLREVARQIAATSRSRSSAFICGRSSAFICGPP